MLIPSLNTQFKDCPVPKNRSFPFSNHHRKCSRKMLRFTPQKEGLESYTKLTISNNVCYLRPLRACPWLDLAAPDGAAALRVAVEREELRMLLLLRVRV